MIFVGLKRPKNSSAGGLSYVDFKISHHNKVITVLQAWLKYFPAFLKKANKLE